MHAPVFIPLLFALLPFRVQESPHDIWQSHVTDAIALRDKGRLADAEQILRSALEEARRLEPDLAPSATTYNNLASIYHDRHQCDLAAQNYRRSIDLWEKLGARGEMYLLRTANHLTALFLECRDLEAAERLQRTLIARLTARRPNPKSDPDVSQALANRGSIQFLKRHYSAARADYEYALAIRVRAGDESSAEAAVLLGNLAFSLYRTGDSEGALAASRRALAIFESVAPPDTALAVGGLINSANLFLMAHRWEEAGPLYERALAAAHRTFGDEHPLIVSAMYGYAAVLKERHRKQEAAVLEARAREIRGRLLHSATRQTIDIRELK
jgi:serine/threonine-protein kinase